MSATQEPGARSLELDGMDGLTPMASTAGTSLYHVDGEGTERAARVVVTDGENRTIVPVSGDHARVSTTLPAGAAAWDPLLGTRALTPTRGTDGAHLRVGAMLADFPVAIYTR